MTKNYFFCTFLFGLLVIQSLAQSNRQSVGNLTYILPAGWAAEPRGNSVVLRPNDAVKSRICMVVITTGLEVRGSFKTWVENQWTLAKGTRREVSRQDIPSQTDSTGAEAMAIAATLQIGNTPKHYHLFSAFRQGTSGTTLSFVTDGEDYLLKYEAAIKAIAGSIRYPETGDTTVAATPIPGRVAPTPSPATVTSPTPLPSEPIQRKQVKTGPRDLPAKLPEPLPMPPGSPDQAARILARTVLEGGDRALPALMRAVLSAGHPIIKRDGTVLFSPVQGTSNGIGILDAEVVFAADSLESEITVSWGGLGRVIEKDAFFSGFDIVPHWKKELAGMAKSTNNANQFCAAFIKAISAESGGLYADPAEANNASPISTIQAHLFLLRSFGALHLALNPNASLSYSLSNTDLTSPGSGPNFEPTAPLFFPSLSDRVTMADLRRSIGSDPGARYIYDALADLSTRRRGGSESEAFLIGITRRIWLMNFLRLDVGDASIPLVRKKVLGMRGEIREYPVRLLLEVPPSAREDFESYARELGVESAVPPNGQIPFDADLAFRPVLAPLNARSAELIEIKNFDLPQGTGSLEPARLIVEGAPQQKNLSENPKEDQKTAGIRIRMEPGQTSRILRERPTIWQLVASELQSTFRFDIPIPVTDWKSDFWRGSIFVQAKGSGAWNSPDQNTQLEWRIDRGFFTEFELDGSVESGLIKGTVRTNPTARGQRQYTTYFPKRNPPVNLQYEDYINKKGPETNCILETIGELEFRMSAKLRNPKGFNEEIMTGTHRGVMIQQEAVEGVSAVQLWEITPPVPITETVQEIRSPIRKGDPPNQPPKTTDKVVSLLNRIRMNRAAGAFVINNALVKKTPTGLLIEDAIDDDFELDLGLKPGSPPQKIRVTIKWKFELVGGTGSGALSKSVDQALAISGFVRGLENFLLNLTAEESPTMVEISFPSVSSGVESCSVASHRIAGKLKHEPKKPAKSSPKK